ncbi:MAG: phosphoribosylanthranilate isomerase, partial [Actinomycetota bacterium]|nr:phosphoribosylanthranilate isomerase [Actinomycetota bacterium]
MVLVKVCGITNTHDALAAAEAGADAIGFIFAPSPRRIRTDEAQEISDVLPENILKVGVFVNASPEEVLRIVREVGLNYAQLHGDEGPEIVAAVQDGGVWVIKAVRVRDAESLEDLDRYGADLYLLDAYSESARGGTGERFDWSLAKTLIGHDNIVVSGGLNPDNVAE